MHRFFALLLPMILAAGLVHPASAGDPPWPPPTDTEIHDAIQRAMESDYLNDNARYMYHYTGVTVAIGPVKRGSFTTKNLNYDEIPDPCWPVRVVATVTATRDGYSDESKTLGDTPGASWYFFPNSFGEWDYRTGTD